MIEWSSGDSRSHTGSSTLPFGWLLCGFNKMGHLWPFHEASQRWAYEDVGPIDQWATILEILR